MEGGVIVSTKSVALEGEVLPMVNDPPMAVDDNAPSGMVLIKLPALMEVTSTETVQEPGVPRFWAGTVPPVRDKVVPPATALTAVGFVTISAQFVVKFGTAAILRPV